MPKLLITADVHGSLGTWMTLRELLDPNDGLAVAGDLFDTKYGTLTDPDFQPGRIRQDLAGLDHPFYYVYGNCDHHAYFPSQEDLMIFRFMETTFLLHHGHRQLRNVPEDIDVIIQGHTHLAALEQDDRGIFLNPGSLAKPRNSLYTYAVFDGNQVSLINIKTGEDLVSIRVNTG